MSSIPINKKLYNKIKSKAKIKFKKWPSAYGSAWLVKEYKKNGGKYKGTKSKSSGISRWMNEKWINVCKLPKKVKCGRSKLSYSNWKKKYPYCRPSKKVNSKTPVLASELNKKLIKKLCSVKHKSPLKKMKSIRKTRRKSKRSTRKSKRSTRKSKRSTRKSKRSTRKIKRSTRKS
jgi:hypothetical protein